MDQRAGADHVLSRAGTEQPGSARICPDPGAGPDCRTRVPRRYQARANFAVSLRCQ
ncbi:MAG TPA: hypothetical protein VIS06_08750 [Mycobacteriales bacterium]